MQTGKHVSITSDVRAREAAVTSIYVCLNAIEVKAGNHDFIQT